MSKPSKIRVTGPEGAAYVTVGKVYGVRAWTNDYEPVIINDEGREWCCASMSRAPKAWYPAWEPADDAPPAAAPTDAVNAAREAFTVAAAAVEKHEVEHDGDHEGPGLPWIREWDRLRKCRHDTYLAWMEAERAAKEERDNA